MSEHGDHTTIKFLRLDGSQNKRRQAVLLVMTGPSTGQTVYLESKSQWRLGRAVDSDLVFQDESVSRNHCLIRHTAEDRWMVEDLQSSNGTWINGEKIRDVELRADDKIQLGSAIVVKFVLQDEIESTFQRELYESATRDGLTGLHSKRFFMEQFEIEFNYHRRIGRPLSLVILDLDHFKKINDSYGHAAGDAVLKQLGGLFLSILRKGDSCGRFGGEEIIFSLRDTPSKGGIHFAERLRRLVENHPFVYDGKKIPVTASLGIATYDNQNFKTSSDVLKQADTYLYQAKRQGRNCVVSNESPLPTL